jgi:pimeloyl-ACP methyl ester carboxylesterase
VVGWDRWASACRCPAGSTRCGATRAEPERARALIELINRPRRRDAEASRRATARRWRQPWYRELFPPPRQRWVDDLALTRAELEAIAAPVLLVHGAQDRVVPLRDSFLPLLEALPDARGTSSAVRPRLPAGTHRRVQPLLTTFLETDR